MRAWVVTTPGPIASKPLVPVERAVPVPGAREIRVKVRACGVCRTDLHLAEGDVAPRSFEHYSRARNRRRDRRLGRRLRTLRAGERVGIAWLRHTCGRCRWCRRGMENLCEQSRFSGGDADGGFSELALVDEAYAYRLPVGYSAAQAAPLLCAGIIGYRALKRAELPNGGRLGIYGFGASAHLAAQVAMNQGATVHVLTRSEAARQHPASSASLQPARPTHGPPNHSMQRSCSPRRNPRSSILSALDAAAARSSLPAFTSATFRRFNTRHTCFAEPTSSQRDRQHAGRRRGVPGRGVAEPTRCPHPGVQLAAADVALADLAADRVTGAAVLVP